MILKFIKRLHGEVKSHRMKKLCNWFSVPSGVKFCYCRYLFCCSYAHNVAPKGKFIAFVSTEAETDNPKVELEPGIKLLGPVDEIFYDNYDRYEPTNDHTADNCFISAVRTLLFHYSACSFII